MVLDPIPQPLPVHFFGSRPQPPTSPHAQDNKSFVNINRIMLFAHINQIMSCFIPMTCWDHMSFVHMNQIEKWIVQSEKIARSEEAHMHSIPEGHMHASQRFICISVRGSYACNLTSARSWVQIPTNNTATHSATHAATHTLQCTAELWGSHASNLSGAWSWVKMTFRKK